MKSKGNKILRRDQLTDKIVVVVGTRPGIIKFSPVIRALEVRKCNYFIIHTGQHYSYNMDKIFFQDLSLPDPRYRIDVTKKAKLHGAQTAEMLKGLERIFIEEKPRLVIVGGDANTNLAGALATRKLGIELAHMEAGLRSNDWRMPEEHNRVMIDHISDYLLAPTEEAKDNLVKDNIKGKIFIVGNPIVDAVYQNIEIAKKKSNILNDLNLRGNDYFVLTIHREENVDYPETLTSILDAIYEAGRHYPLPIIFPIHPRAKKRLKEFNLDQKIAKLRNLKIIKPVGYLDFLLLLSEARLVLTDSGGIQEECCILKIPSVTLRNNTERPETIKVGSNTIGGTNLKSIMVAINKMLEMERNWPNPFGDGKAAERIISIILEHIKH